MIRQWRPSVLFEAEGGEGGGSLLTGIQPGGNQEGNQDQTNNEPPAGNNPDGGGSQDQVPGWVSGLTADLRDNEFVKGHAKPSDFVKAALGWKSKADGSIVKPGEGATPEEVAAYNKALGIPAKAEDYQLPDNKLLGKDFAAAQRELFLKQGLSQDQAKSVYEATIKQLQGGADAIKKANQTARAEAETALKKEFGDKYTQTLTDAQSALRRFAPEELISYLDKTGLGNHVGLIKMLSAIQGQIGGDSLLSGANAGGNSDPNEEGKRRFPNSPQMYS